MSKRRTAALTLLLLGLGTSVAPACSVSEGQGRVVGTLDVPNCWTGRFDLDPDFFAGVYDRGSLQLRIQNGSDSQTFSDGLSILVNDVRKVRPAGDFPGRYGEPLQVGLPPEVTPPGVPIQPTADPPLAALSLYLQRSCRTQSVALYAVPEVTVTDDGTCQAEPVAAADPATGCRGELSAGVGNGKSLISFGALYNGQFDASASDRRIQGCFDVYLADPREGSPTGVGPPPPCRGHLRGRFDFFFERGRPAQAFP
jgi:hypothetical protein